MRRTTHTILGLAVLAAASTVAMPVHAADGPFGLGIIVGEPTGLSAKLWTTDRTALAGAAAWSFTDDAALHVHGDYLWHFRNRVQVDDVRLPVYVGIGGRLKAEDDDSRLGIRVPVGLAYTFADAPFDVFVELAPVLDLAPETEFRGNAAIGARWYFR